jgi:uncharacterized protein YceH (UPF0502 family)
MYRFETLDDVQSGLQKLMDRQPSLVAVLPRQPGTKESRYTHLFSGNYIPEATTVAESSSSDFSRNSHDQRLAKLEAEVAELRLAVEDLRRHFAEFAAQFK